MTLIVGVKAPDGIVIAADGAATLVVPGAGKTVRQATKKISVLNKRNDKIGSALMACSGDVGLAQRYEFFVNDVVASGGYQENVHEGNRQVREKLGPVFEHELRVAQLGASIVGVEARGSAVCLFLLAVAVTNKELQLVEFNVHGAPTVASESLPFVSIGSGQRTADPFLAFLRRVLWNGEAPKTRKEAILGAYWTVSHAINVSPGGVGEQVDVALLTIKNGTPHARLLVPQDLQEHQQRIASAEKSLGMTLRGKVAVGGEAPSLPSDAES